MGLDFSHSDARWSYGGFMDFRKRIAESIGLGDLDSMKGFGGDRQWPSPLNDPIIDLLNHSDCDGELTAEQCRAIAPRLREIVQAWPDDGYPASYDKRMAMLLADGMEEAAAKGQVLEFC